MESISQKEYNEITECKCGGPVFKFINSSTNTLNIKCGYITQEYDIKKKEMVKAKRQPCGWSISTVNNNNTIQETITEKISTEKKDNNGPEEQLLLLFKYLFISKKQSTLMEINNIVKNKLLRKPEYSLINNKIPDINEYEKYRSRVFSRPIIERKPIIIYKNPKKPTSCSVIVDQILKNIKNINTNNIITNTNDFIEDYLDSESDSDKESDSDNSDKEPESDDSDKEELKNDFIIDSEPDIPDEIDDESDYYSDS
jgi:hypothetical protein